MVRCVGTRHADFAVRMWARTEKREAIERLQRTQRGGRENREFIVVVVVVVVVKVVVLSESGMALTLGVPIFDEGFVISNLIELVELNALSTVKVEGLGSHTHHHLPSEEVA